MTKYLLRSVALVVACILAGEPTVSPIAEGIRMPCLPHALVQTTRFQEEALSLRSLIALHPITPLWNLFKKFIGSSAPRAQTLPQTGFYSLNMKWPPNHEDQADQSILDGLHERGYDWLVDALRQSSSKLSTAQKSVLINFLQFQKQILESPSMFIKFALKGEIFTGDNSKRLAALHIDRKGKATAFFNAAYTNDLYLLKHDSDALGPFIFLLAELHEYLHLSLIDVQNIFWLEGLFLVLMEHALFELRRFHNNSFFGISIDRQFDILRRKMDGYFDPLWTNRYLEIMQLLTPKAQAVDFLEVTNLQDTVWGKLYDFLSIYYANPKKRWDVRLSPISKILENWRNWTHILMTHHSIRPDTPRESHRSETHFFSTQLALSSSEIHALRRPGIYLLKALRFFRWVPWLTSALRTSVSRFQSHHDALSNEQRHQLARTKQAGLAERASEFVGVRVESFPNERELLPESIKRFREIEGYTPLILILTDRILIKESVFACSDPVFLSLLLGYGRAMIWLVQHDRLNRALMWIARHLFRIPKGDELDFVAKAINLFTFSFFWRFLPQIGPLLNPPPVALDELLAGATFNLEEEALLRSAYQYEMQSSRDQEGKAFKYPSGKTYWGTSTGMARDVAELGLGANARTAALLINLQSTEIYANPEVLADNLHISIDNATYIQDLSKALRYLLITEPFEPKDPPSDAPDYGVQNGTNRLFEIVSEAARLYKVEFRELLALLLSEKSELISTYHDQFEKKEIEKLYREIKFIHAPAAERSIGQRRLPEKLRNEALRYHDPERYQKANEIFRRGLKMSPKQSRQELRYFNERLKTVMNEDYELIPYRILDREKSYASDEESRAVKEWEKRQEGKEPKEEELASKDALAWRVVVDTPEELELIRHSVIEKLDSPQKPLTLLPENIKIKRLNGRIARVQLNFQYDNPYAQGHRITAELQLMTKEYYQIHLSGSAPAKYQYGHWQYKSKIAVDREVGIPPQPGILIGQQFDHEDPPFVDDFNVDPDHIRDGLQDWIHPIYSLDSTVLDPFEDSGPERKITGFDFKESRGGWPSIKLPRGALVADLVFHPDIGGKPDDYRQPYRLKAVEDPEHPGEFLAQREPLLLTDRLLPGDRIVFGAEPGPALNTIAEQARLYQNPVLATAWAKLKLYPSRPRRKKIPNPGYLTQLGRKLITEAFGPVDASFRHDVLVPVLYELHLSEREFYQALALALLETSGPNASIWRKVKENFEGWFRKQYVQFQFAITEVGNGIHIDAKVDEDQIRLLAEITAIPRQLGIRIMRDKVRPTDEGGAEVHLEIARKDTFGNPVDLKDLAHRLRGIRRKRGDMPPPEGGERIELHMSFTERAMREAGALNEFSQRLSDLGANIEEERPDPVDGGRNMTLVITVPRRYHYNPALRLDEAIAEEQRALARIVETEHFEFQPADYSEATVAEIVSFLISEGSQMDERYWPELPFDPTQLTALQQQFIHRGGRVDEVAVARFKRMWGITKHFQPSEDHEWAARQVRDSGAPYQVHLMSVVWNLLVTAKVHDPITILSAAGHDLFEDGVKNIIKQGKTYSEEEARNVILHWISQALPPYLERPVLAVIEELTQRPNEDYAQYRTRLRSGSIRAKLIKCTDQDHNLLDADRRRMSRAMRFYLDFLNLDDELAKSKDIRFLQAYKIIRARLFKRIITHSLHYPNLAVYHDSPPERIKDFREKRKWIDDEEKLAEAETIASIWRFMSWVTQVEIQNMLLADSGIKMEDLQTAIRHLQVLSDRILGSYTEPPKPARLTRDSLLAYFKETAKDWAIIMSEDVLHALHRALLYANQEPSLTDLASALNQVQTGLKNFALVNASLLSAVDQAAGHELLKAFDGQGMLLPSLDNLFQEFESKIMSISDTVQAPGDVNSFRLLKSAVKNILRVRNPLPKDKIDPSLAPPYLEKRAA